jgi:type IV secretion system protein VirB3
MTGVGSRSDRHIDGFEAPIHPSLVDPILLGGAPRAVAIINGTLAASLGLGLQQWIAGVLVWAVGHTLAVAAARRDPDFLVVALRHLRQRGRLAC